MGMFDSVFINIKCPYCDEISKMECQTKELSCNLNRWEIGDFVTDEYRYLNCITSCHSDECVVHGIKYYKNPSIGRHFRVKVFLVGSGRVSGKYKYLNIESIKYTLRNL